MSQDNSKALIVVGSTNPTKVNAVKIALSQLFPDEKFEIKAEKVESGVSSQPVSSSETMNGAINRAKECSKLYPLSKYCIGIEGGIAIINDIPFQAVFVAVLDNKSSKKTIGIGISQGMELSFKIYNKIKNNKNTELNEVLYDITGEKNIGKKEGYFGLMTNNISSRTKANIQALIMAFAKFISNPKYWD